MSVPAALSSGPSLQPIRIAIAGGGIAGLCLTIGLLRYPQIQIQIYEAAAKFSEIGAGVAFGINAQRALWLLDPRIKGAYEKIGTSNVSSNVHADQEKSTYFKIQLGIDHKDGKAKAGDAICEVMCQGGFSSVHRANFLDEMVALLPDEVRSNNVSFGHKVVSVKDGEKGKGVALNFANGSTATADVLIGCDGIKSEIRKIVLGRDSPEAHATFTGKYAYRGLIPMSKAAATLGDSLARNSQHYHGYDGHVLTFPIEKEKTMNVVAFRTKRDGEWKDEEWVKPVEREEMERDFKGWGSNVQAILRMMEKCDIWALFDHPPAKTYHKSGKICLLGDAAHASTPHHGSGAGMAVEDAFILSRLLGEIQDVKELEFAFETYEMIRKDRTQRLVRSSRDQAMIYEWQADGIGDDLQKISEILPYRWDWIWDEILEDELKEAKSILKRRVASANV
jgi:salicylate hydroxylase